MNPAALPSPSSQALPLKALHLPEAISWWPLAPGWWLLLISTLVVLGLLAWWLLRHYRVKQYQRAARAELRVCYKNWQQHQNNQLLLQQVNHVLKRVCRQRLPAGLSLSGEPWVEFLNQSAGKTVFIEANARALAQGLYCPSEQLADLPFSATHTADLLNACQNWLKHIHSNHIYSNREASSWN
ncbi:DUF4381 domain-containing protein [Bacterioplanoides sp.]|uniref:DUF4381 domain-containing protein n=1 Tax=Bacterioplanoides sp. TaxID=2066072 RepID=UPI003B00A36F